MENTAKIILALFIITLSSCNQKDKYTLIKGNLYETGDNQIVMKLVNKKVAHPSQEKTRKDTIYQSHFRFEHIDSILVLKDVIDVETYKIIDDTYFEDKNYIYINSYYKSGEHQYKIVKKDSNTFFANDTLKTSIRRYHKGNIVRQ